MVLNAYFINNLIGIPLFHLDFPAPITWFSNDLHYMDIS